MRLSRGDENADVETVLRNEEYLAPARSVLHLSSLVLHGANGNRVGRGICGLGGGDVAVDADLCFRSFSRRVAARGDSGVFCRRQVSRSGYTGLAGEKEAAGLVCSAAEQEYFGVWVLL